VKGGSMGKQDSNGKRRKETKKPKKEISTV